MFFSILYVFSNLLLITLFLLIKKSSKKQNILLWIFLSLILLFCYNSIIVYVLSVCNIKSTLISLTICNFLCSICFIINIHMKKNIQEYFFRLKDMIFTIVMLVIIIIIGYLRFGKDLEIIYETCDPATHFWTSMEFFKNSELLNANTSAVDFSTRVFGSYVNAGIIFKIASPFVGYIDLYIVYMFYDLFMLFLAGLMFYFLISYVCKKTSFIIIFIGSLLYLLGYPLNNMIFGFFYSGHNVTIIASLILIINLIKYKDIENNLGIILTMILNIGICFTYYFFAPVVTLALFIYYLYNSKNKQKFINRDFMLKVFFTCVIPFLLCVSYFVIPHFDKQQFSILYQLKLDGYFYNSGLSNFIVFLPLVVYYCYNKCKTKNFDFEFFITFTLFLVISIFILLIVFDIAVPYYLSKYSYVLWLICFLITFKLFDSQILKKDLYIIFCISFCIISICSMFNLERKFLHKNQILWNMRESTNILDVYSFNFDKINNGDVHLSKGEINIIKNLHSLGATNVINNFVASYDNQKLWLNAFFWEEKLNCSENSIYNCLNDGLFFDPQILENYKHMYRNYEYYVVFYRDEAGEKYTNYNSIIPFEIQRRWDENFTKDYVINKKEIYDQIPRNDCENCEFIDFEDGMIIIKKEV